MIARAMAEDQVVKNMQVLFNYYVTGFAKESDMLKKCRKRHEIESPKWLKGILVKQILLVL